MARRINIAAGIIQEASKAVSAMPLMTVFPVFPLILLVGLFAWFAYVAAGLASAGQISTESLLSTASDVASDVTGSEINITANFSLAGVQEVQGVDWAPWLGKG